MWLFRSKVGVFWIRSQVGGGFMLGLDDQLLGSFDSPDKAAEAVYRQRTGFSQWDNRLVVVHPKTLGAWERQEL